MNINGYELTGHSETFFTPYQSNGATVYVYKSARLNSKLESFSINHLIGNIHGDRKISDESILLQFIDSVDRLYYFRDKYDKYHRNIYVAAHCTYFKQAVRKCVNGYYGRASVCYRTFDKHKYHTFEQMLNFLLEVYNTVYPYNTLDSYTVFENPSVAYYINKWYKREV